MNFISQYMPQVITGMAILVAILSHYWLQKKFWQPCFIAALLSTFIGFCFILVWPIQLPANVDSHYELAVNMSYFTLAFSFVLALLIGYVMKLMPKLFN